MNGFAVDTGTASLLTSFASFAIAVWLFGLRSHLPSISVATRIWAWSLLLQGVGWLGLAFRLKLPIEYSGIPGTVLVFIAGALQLRAYTVLVPQRRSFTANYVLLGIAVAAHLFFGYTFPHGPARACIGSAFGALLAVQCAYILFTISPAHPVIRASGWLYAAITAILVYRFAVYAPLLDQPQVDGFALAAVAEITGLLLFLNVIFPSIGFVHVCTQLLDRRTEVQALHDAALLDAIFEQAPVGMSIIGSDRLPIRFNAQIQEMFGFKIAADLPVSFAAGNFFRENGSQYPDGVLPDPLGLRDFQKPVPEVYGFQAAGSSQIRWISTRAVYLREFDVVLRISHDISELINAKAALVAAYTNLEERVAERTCELTEVNAELETFSYSLSHDMKAPLTRIEGWTNVLLEEHRSALGESGQKTILFLKQEIAGMQAMIGAMLSLSKASTADLVSAEIDVSGLVAAELLQIKGAYPETNLKFTIEPQLQVRADPVLFKVLMHNLLENALKFSSKQETSEIFVGKLTNLEDSVYFVRDNGDGFDMQYADRLFGPFQRMHTQKEFPGTGIGLATAQRIVHRHGGRIWVESQKGLGTTFYFSIPRANHPEGERISQ